MPPPLLHNLFSYIAGFRRHWCFGWEGSRTQFFFWCFGSGVIFWPKGSLEAQFLLRNSHTPFLIQKIVSLTTRGLICL